MYKLNYPVVSFFLLLYAIVAAIWPYWLFQLEHNSDNAFLILWGVSEITIAAIILFNQDKLFKEVDYGV